MPYIFGGLPLFANPGSTFHPFRFLGDLLFPVKDIFPTIFLLQFGFAGLGMYLLARELEVREWIAGVAGLAFEFTGLAMSFVYAGHDGRIIVVTSGPLLFYFLHRGIRTGRIRPFVGAAVTVGFLLLSFQIQTAYYLLMAASAWALFCLISQGWMRKPSAAGRRVGLGLAAVVLGFAMAAVNFLPFMDYVAASPRGKAGGLGYAYSTSYSMPPAEVVGLAVPEQAGNSVVDRQGNPEFPSYEPSELSPFKLHTEYVGAFVVALLFLGGFYMYRDRRWWFFAGLGAVALSFAFGGFTPIFHLYWSLLPGASKFRAPNLTFFLVSTSLVAMAALTLERLAALRDEAAANSRRAVRGDPLSRVGWVLAGLLVLTVIGAGIAPGTATSDAAARTAGWLRFGVFLAVTAAALWLWARRHISSRAAAVALALITLVDLWIVDRRFFETTEPPSQAFAPDDVIDFLRSQPGTFRVWVLPSPPFPPQATYPRQGNLLMHFDIQQAGGEHSTPIERFLQVAGPGERSMVDWHNFLQDAAFMDVANVKYLVTGVPIQAPNLKEVHRGRLGVVYENLTALPRAWLVPSVEVADPPDGAVEAMQRPDFDPRRTAVLYRAPPEPLPNGPLEGDAEIRSYEPDRVVVRTRASRAALLVLADNDYTGWQASVDGDARPILLTNHAFRGVEVPAGDHQVVFRFAPPDLRLGFWIYLASLALVAAYGVWTLADALRGRSGKTA